MMMMAGQSEKPVAQNTEQKRIAGEQQVLFKF